MTSSPRSLLRAAADGDANIVRELLAEGADVNGTTEGGRTALMLAALLGHEEIVALLLNAGANARLQDKVGLTALDWATRRGFASIIQLIGNALSNELPDQTNAKLGLVDSSVDDEAPDQISYYADVAPEIHPTPDLNASDQTEESDVPTAKFGGAAGAILRTRAAELNQQAQSQEPPATLARESEILLSSPPLEARADDLALMPTDVPTPSVTPVNEAPHSDFLFLSPPPEATANDGTLEPSDVPTASVAPVHEVSHSDILWSSSAPEATGDDITLDPLDVPTASVAAVHEVSQPDILLSWPAPEATADNITLKPTEVPTASGAPLNAVSPKRDVLDDDTTIASAISEVSTLPAERPDISAAAPPEKRSAGTINPEVPKVTVRTAATASQSVDSLTEKRCPKCETRYESTRLRCPRDNTLLVKIKASSFSSIPSHSSRRPLSWLLVVITLLGSAFVAYRANSYFFPTAAPVSSPIAAKTERPAALPIKTAPVIGGDLVGMELLVPDAEYPDDAAARGGDAGAAGNVTVRVHVNQKGKVISAQALDGDERLRGAAVKAGKSAAFSPEKLRGKGRTVTGTITYNFVAPRTSANGPSNTASKAVGSATQTASAVSQPSPAIGSSPANAAANSPASDDQFPLTGGPLAGTELNLPKPQYPSSAKSRGISGTISIVVRVNRAGRVISWRTGEGDPQLRAAALKAAKQATFSPGKLPGKGEVVGTITYNFKL